MSQSNANPTNKRRCGSIRRGAVVVYVAVCGTVIIGFAALAVDIGMLYAAHAEMQRAADAAAMSAAWELLDEERLLGGSFADYVCDQARESAAYAASCNLVLRSAPVVLPEEDVDIGYLSDFTYGSNLIFSEDAPANATRVRVRRDAERGGSIALFFAKFLGSDSRDMVAEAVAGFADNVVGFDTEDPNELAGLLPFTLKIESWEALVDGIAHSGDNYTVNPDGTVSAGADGIVELNFYPGDMNGQLPPGNFGTIDIGPDDNSAQDAERQIRYGVSAEDLSYFPNGFTLGEDGTLLVNGDTGLSAGFKDGLEAIKGQPRTLPLFSTVQYPGNNAVFTIVGFGGIRILNVRLTGPMGQKEVIMQPAVVVDSTAVTQPGTGDSYFVYAPVRLVR